MVFQNQMQNFTFMTQKREMKRNLTDAKKGEEIIVLGVEESHLRSKLMEFGIIKGKKMRLLFTAPFGDPIAVDMDGFVLSLRKSEAQLISIE